MKKEEAFKNLKIENSLMSSDKKICVVDFTTLPPSCLHFSAYFDMSFQATGISTFFVRTSDFLSSRTYVSCNSGFSHHESSN